VTAIEFDREVGWRKKQPTCQGETGVYESLAMAEDGQNLRNRTAKHECQWAIRQKQTQRYLLLSASQPL
jgi:hypothetical protein